MIRAMFNGGACVFALALTGCATTIKAPEIPLLDGNSFSKAQAAPEPK